MTNSLLFLLLLSLVAPFVFGDCTGESVTSTPVTLLSLTFPIMTFKAVGPTASSWDFLNLHRNENTSILAARAFSCFYGGSTTLLDHGGQRRITFADSALGVTWSIDPNRIFTDIGRNATLSQDAGPVQGLGAARDRALAAAKALADAVLVAYGWDRVKVVVAMHNNGGSNYSGASYLPGGVYASDAAKVNIVAGSDPRQFFFVIDPSYYDALVKQGQNVVLQSGGGVVTDDGSLSVYAQMSKKTYVNVEAGAEGGSRGDQSIKQIIMLEALARARVEVEGGAPPGGPSSAASALETKRARKKAKDAVTGASIIAVYAIAVTGLLAWALFMKK
jgi:hypothetical protein